MTTPVIKTVFSGRNKLVVNITAVFDTSDASDVVVVDRSTLTGPNGSTPTDIRVDEITWSVGAGFDYCVLEFDDNTDEVIEYLQGQGYMDYRPYGGKTAAETTPDSAGEGDILLTTVGGAADATLSILLACTLKD